MRYIGMFLIVILVALVSGLVMYAADRAGFYLIVLLPILAGSLIGVAAVGLFLKDTAPLHVSLFISAIIGCGICLAIFWGGQYLDYHNALVATIMAEIPNLTRPEAETLLAEFQQTEWGTTGFGAFMADRAAAGISISRVASSSSIDLKDGMAYAYWIGEAILMLAFAVFTVFRRDKLAERMG